MHIIRRNQHKGKEMIGEPCKSGCSAPIAGETGIFRHLGTAPLLPKHKTVAVTARVSAKCCPQRAESTWEEIRAA
jgi:hypothetical protein